MQQWICVYSWNISAMKVHISSQCCKALEDYGGYFVTFRGTMEMKVCYTSTVLGLLLCFDLNVNHRTISMKWHSSLICFNSFRIMALWSYVSFILTSFMTIFHDTIIYKLFTGQGTARDVLAWRSNRGTGWIIILAHTHLNGIFYSTI